jgi:RHS repeat-associated protein
MPRPANVRRWIYADALNPVAQLDERNRITQAYVYGNYAHTPDYLVAFTYADAESTSPSSTTRYRYVYDIRGSVRLVVNASTGDIAQQLDYGPWGEVLDDSAPGFQPFGYAGGEYDATTDLVRFGARDYDAEIGRWTAKDPIGFAGGDTNLYAYVGGDPIGLVDVTGEQSVAVCEYYLGAGNDHYYLWTAGSTTYGSAPSGGDKSDRFLNAFTDDIAPGGESVPCWIVPSVFGVTSECVDSAVRDWNENPGPYMWLLNDCWDSVSSVINQCANSPVATMPYYDPRPVVVLQDGLGLEYAP